MMNIIVSVNTILDRLEHVISSITANKDIQGSSLSKIAYYVN